MTIEMIKKPVYLKISTLTQNNTKMFLTLSCLLKFLYGHLIVNVYKQIGNAGVAKNASVKARIFETQI